MFLKIFLQTTVLQKIGKLKGVNTFMQDDLNRLLFKPKMTFTLVLSSPSAYQHLLQQLNSREVTSGDSFYVRVNMSLSGGVAGMLSVTCNDILHVTDSHYGGDGYWWASRVHSYQLNDLKCGRVPNFYR